MTTKRSSSGGSAVKSRPTPSRKSTTKTTTSAGGTTDKTRITVHFDAGFPNELFIRGHGANLSWDKGIRLKNVKHDEWVWETSRSFKQGEFKILINDTHFEIGDNHVVKSGTQIALTPNF